MPYQPILATLGYVFDPSGERVLLIHRNKRSDDAHLGKFNGLGGKLEPHEDPVTCMRRELHEESGLIATRMELRGTINWPGFGKNGESWFGFLFRITAFTGDLRADNPEGDLSWHALDALGDLPMWPGDRDFLPLVLAGSGPCFHGVMPYSNGMPVSWQYQILETEASIAGG
ncbi:MAG: 8-oxo-dGTP diphosphatase [Planctomycetota bacterium]|nr:8-oxo-dGTP diphosphatase [Planctomycetota bacterium]